MHFHRVCINVCGGLCVKVIKAYAINRLTDFNRRFYDECGKILFSFFKTRDLWKKQQQQFKKQL